MVSILIVILHAKDRARESQNLAKGDKYGIMDFAGRRHDKTCNEQATADDYKEYGCKQLKSWFVFANFHCKKLCMWGFMIKFAYRNCEAKLSDPDTSACK